MRVSLRMLVIVFSGICVVLAIYAAIRQGQAHRAKITGHIRSQGGTVAYEDQWQFGQSWISEAPPESPLTKLILGPRALSRVVVVELPPDATVDISHLGCFRHIEFLGLRGRKLDQSDVSHILRFSSLKHLDLIDATIGDADVRRIVGACRELRVVELQGTDISNASLSYLASLKNLFSLNVSGTDVDDEGVRRLARSKSIKSLDLRYTRVTASSVPVLAEFNQLLRVSLYGSRVSDNGKESLRKLRSQLEVE